MSNLMNLTMTAVDGKVHDVSATFGDLAKYDVLRAKYGFPKKDEAEFLFMALVSFAALIRTGVIPATTKVDDFIGSIASLELAEAEEAEEPVDESFRTAGGNSESAASDV